MERLVEKTSELEPLQIKSDSLVAKECPKHGPYESQAITVNGIETLKHRGLCPKCMQENRERAEEEERQRRCKTLLSCSDIPLRFKGCSIDGLAGSSPGIVHVRKVCKGFVQNFQERGPSLVFIGNVGTGKTHAACAIGLELMRAGHSVKYTSEYKMTKAIKGTWNEDSERSEDQVIREYLQPDLLIIDEIGLAFDSSAQRILFYQVMNGRYEAMKPCIIIGNLTQAELTEHLGERILDRLREGGGVTVVFDWASHRK